MGILLMINFEKNMTVVKINGNKKDEDSFETGLIEAAFDFWFKNNGHIRSPFPAYIREKLRLESTEKFLSWCKGISIEAKKEINDEILAEKLEEIIFERAYGLVLTEDEKLTIKYPFMPRLEDLIKDNETAGGAEGKVVDRWLVKRGDFTFMKLKISNIKSGEIQETEFELPE